MTKVSENVFKYVISRIYVQKEEYERKHMITVGDNKMLQVGFMFSDRTAETIEIPGAYETEVVRYSSEHQYGKKLLFKMR